MKRLGYKQFDFPVCMNCTHRFWYGEMVFHSRHGYHNFICRKCSEIENEMAYIYRGDNYHHCIDCGSIINFGDMVFCGKWRYRCYMCQYYYDKRESGLMTGPICGDCEHYNGRNLCRKQRYTEGKLDLAICPDFEGENMTNIKITAEVDGKQVPLNTISTESFEAIKALEKPKEIPVARVGYFSMCPSEGRLILKITPNIRTHVAEPGEHVLAIDTTTGVVAAWWEKESDEDRVSRYGNIISL